jgi:hypothetical protein
MSIDAFSKLDNILWYWIETHKFVFKLLSERPKDGDSYCTLINNYKHFTQFWYMFDTCNYQYIWHSIWYLSLFKCKSQFWILHSCGILFIKTFVLFHCKPIFPIRNLSCNTMQLWWIEQTYNGKLHRRCNG